MSWKAGRREGSSCQQAARRRASGGGAPSGTGSLSFFTPTCAPPRRSAIFGRRAHQPGLYPAETGCSAGGPSRARGDGGDRRWLKSRRAMAAAHEQTVARYIELRSALSTSGSVHGRACSGCHCQMISQLPVHKLQYHPSSRPTELQLRHTSPTCGMDPCGSNLHLQPNNAGGALLSVCVRVCVSGGVGGGPGALSTVVCC